MRVSRTIIYCMIVKYRIGGISKPSIQALVDLQQTATIHLTRALNRWRMGVSYQSAVIPLSRAPFHQHHFDVTPLVEQELVLDLVGVIRA
jgi:hypothetical protein